MHYVCPFKLETAEKTRTRKLETVWAGAPGVPHFTPSLAPSVGAKRDADGGAERQASSAGPETRQQGSNCTTVSTCCQSCGRITRIVTREPAASRRLRPGASSRCQAGHVAGAEL